MSVSISSDYAVMQSGNLRFYFGYERTKGEEWCFTVELVRDRKEVMCVPQSKLGVRDRWEVSENLLAGISLWINAGCPKEPA